MMMTFPIVLQRASARGRQYPRAVHGGRALGHGHRRHRRVAHDGALPHHARHIHQGGDAGQAGHAQRVRVPRIQDTVRYSNFESRISLKSLE